MARPTKENGTLTKESAPPPSPRVFGGFSQITSVLWSVADLLRGDYTQADYGKVILPLTVLRWLDCVLAKTKAKLLAKHEELKAAKHHEGTIEKMLVRASGTNFYNTSKFDLEKLKGDPSHLAANLTSYIKGFSANARDNFELAMKPKVEGLMIDRMAQNQEIVTRYRRRSRRSSRSSTASFGPGAASRRHRVEGGETMDYFQATVSENATTLNFPQFSLERE